MDQVIIRMPKAEHDALRERAGAEERSMSVVMRRAFRQYEERAEAVEERI